MNNVIQNESVDPTEPDGPQPESSEVEPELMHREDVDEIVVVVKTLGDAVRFQIIDVLITKGEKNVTELIALTDTTSQPAISHHIGLMKAAGVIEPRRDGKHIFYEISRGRRGQIVRQIYSVLIKILKDAIIR